jgi:hypothetical protein
LADDVLVVLDWVRWRREDRRMSRLIESRLAPRRTSRRWVLAGTGLVVAVAAVAWSPGGVAERDRTVGTATTTSVAVPPSTSVPVTVGAVAVVEPAPVAADPSAALPQVAASESPPVSAPPASAPQAPPTSTAPVPGTDESGRGNGNGIGPVTNPGNGGVAGNGRGRDG